MASSGHDDPKSRTLIETQAITLLNNNADVLELLGELDLSLHRPTKVAKNSWSPRNKFAFESMVKALYLQELMDLSNPQLASELLTNPEDAKRLGFDDVPNQSTIWRTRNTKLESDFIDYLVHTSRRIREYAEEHVPDTELPPLNLTQDTTSISRCEDTEKREAVLDIGSRLHRKIFDDVDMGLPDKGNEYTVHDFLDLEAFLCARSQAAESGQALLQALRPSGHEPPDSDTLLHYLRALSIEDIDRITQTLIARQLQIAKRHPEFKRPPDTGADETYGAYYGNRDAVTRIGKNKDEVVVQGARPSKGYEWCHKFATTAIIGDNVRFFLGAAPDIRGHRIGEIVRDIYPRTAELLNINHVYADAEFFAADVIQALDRAGVSYIIRAANNSRVKRLKNRATHSVWVEENHAIHGPTESGPTNDRVETTLVGIPSYNDDSQTVVFATNTDLDDEIELDRLTTKNRINQYSRRWGIETNYRTLADFIPATSSKSFHVRYFHFNFGLVMHNMWRLVDFLYQLEEDSLEHRYKPRICRKNFLRHYEDVIIESGID